VLGFAGVFGTEHKFCLLTIERVDACLLLAVIERPVIDSEGVILFRESVAEDVAAKGSAVCFPTLEAACLQLPAWEPNKLLELVSNQCGQVDVKHKETVITDAELVSRLEDMAACKARRSEDAGDWKTARDSGYWDSFARESLCTLLAC
jgi:hypothetical protein